MGERFRSNVLYIRGERQNVYMIMHKNLEKGTIILHREMLRKKITRKKRCK